MTRVLFLTALFIAITFVVATRKSNGCSAWQIGTLSGYDNLNGADDKIPGSLAEYTGTTKAMLEAVPVASILFSDWNKYKYHNITVRRRGVTGTVQSWDQCVNANCPGGEKDCCTKNAKKFGGNFLLDIDHRTLLKLWGITKYEDTLEKIEFQICDPFDPAPIAKKWHLKKYR
jgi:hypothetical protein